MSSCSLCSLYMYMYCFCRSFAFDYRRQTRVGRVPTPRFLLVSEIRIAVASLQLNVSAACPVHDRESSTYFFALFVHCRSD